MGLVTGLVLTITCFTGAVLVYEKELQHLFHHSRYYTTVTGKRLSIEEQVQHVERARPNAKVLSVKTFSDPERNTEIAITPHKSQKKNAKSSQGKKKRELRLIAFVDPYTGDVKEIYNHRESFFYRMMDLHRWMLGGDVGKWIVGTCTLIFLFILITGIILWWPKNKAILKQRLKIKWGSGFKRMNHDYHVVVGFYSSLILLVLAFTGLAWSFEWFNNGIYTLTNSTRETPKPPKSEMQQAVSTIDQAWVTVKNKVASPYYQIQLPGDSAAAYRISVLPQTAAHESATDQYFIDQYSGKLIGTQLFSEKNTGQRVRAAFKPVHTASIYGQWSKALGFLACLAGTFFPVSGTIMWINRIRKKKRGKRNSELVPIKKTQPKEQVVIV